MTSLDPVEMVIADQLSGSSSTNTANDSGSNPGISAGFQISTPRYFDNCQASSDSAGCKSNRFLKSNEVVSHQVLNPRLNKAATAPRFLQKLGWRVEQQGSSAQEREPF